MKLLLKRELLADTYTLGTLFLDGKQFGYTCEDADRKLEDGGTKIYGITAIPRGSYKVILTYSHRFNKTMPEVLGVPGFEGVRFHGGNRADDSLGCVLLGSQRTKDGISNCASVNQRLIDLMQVAEDSGEKVTLEVV